MSSVRRPHGKNQPEALQQAQISSVYREGQGRFRPLAAGGKLGTGFISGVSYEAIYQWIWRGKRQKDPMIKELNTFLKHGRTFDADMYFTRPYTLEEVRTVENKIGLIRHFFPKDLDLRCWLIHKSKPSNVISLIYPFENLITYHPFNTRDGYVTNSKIRCCCTNDLNTA